MVRNAVLLAMTVVLAGWSISAIAAGQLKFIIDLPANAEQVTTIYQCEGLDDQFPVTYLNAPPNFLAIVPIDGKDIIMSSTVAASGVRYVSGAYVWWTKGPESKLIDAQAEEDSAPLLTCSEFNEIP